jgi:hypothetical protein
LTLAAAPARLGVAAALALALVFSAQAQQPAQPDAAQQPTAPAAQSGNTQQPAAAPTETAAPTQATPAATASEAPLPGGITEVELRQLLVGKALYLRGGYLDNNLSFNENGRLIGHSPQGSYTLNAIQIEKVHLLKHKVKLEGVRYGLHFTAQLAYEDPSKAFDRVRITPRKNVVKITIDREMVVNPKRKFGLFGGKGKNKKAENEAPALLAAEPAELSEADQLKASIAAAPEAERPADPKSVTTTLSPAHATQVLKAALDQIFSQGLDGRMMAAMPDFWKLYYQAVAAKSDYRPQDPAVLRQNMVDKKAVLVSSFTPDSNEYAQANAVAGMALYYAVIGTDGKAGEIAVGRPIGFGLDENAVAAIRKATFQPAVKDGKPVPVVLDLVVEFRIYDKRTSVIAPPEPAEKPAEPVLPGPYSVPRP